MCDLCTLKCDMYMKKQERKEKKKIFQLCRLPWQSAKLGTTACKTRFADRLFSWQSGKPLPTAFLLAVGKAFADCFSPGSRESLCRLPGRRSAKETGRDGDGVFTDWLYGRRGSLYRLLSGRQSEKNSFPTSSLPAPLCRLPRRKTVGKAFADRFSAFADCFRQSAKRPIPVVNSFFLIKTYEFNEFGPYGPFLLNADDGEVLIVTVNLKMCRFNFSNVFILHRTIS